MPAAIEDPAGVQQQIDSTAGRTRPNGQADRAGRVLQSDHSAAQPYDGIASIALDFSAEQSTGLHSPRTHEPATGHSGREWQQDRKVADRAAPDDFAGEPGVGE